MSNLEKARRLRALAGVHARNVKKALSLLALAGVHARNGNKRRALAALDEAVEDDGFEDALEAVADAVDSDELPDGAGDADDGVEDDVDDDGEEADADEDDSEGIEEVSEDFEELTPDERQDVTEAILEGEGIDDDESGDLPDFDDVDEVVSFLVTAGVNSHTIRRYARPLLASVSAGFEEDAAEGDDADLQGFDPDKFQGAEEDDVTAGNGKQKASVTASVAARIARNKKRLLAAAKS